MGDVKVRTDFTSSSAGIDSNTISAGEDNLHIILTALVSLKYYFDCIDPANIVESILLIDELDATLHPSYQAKLLDLFEEFAKNYKIQIVFTTHSLSAIKFALDKRTNVIYLIDDEKNVLVMEEPNIHKIQLYLDNITQKEQLNNRKIPLFTEDDEARIFLAMIFNHFCQKIAGFNKIKSIFHFVQANIGADNLKNIFHDQYLSSTIPQYICILDGDQKEDPKDEKKHNIICLPGNSSPEKLVMDYSVTLLERDDPFWREEKVLELNYGKMYYRDKILPDINKIDQTLEKAKTEGESVHGKERQMRKSTFKKHQEFFELMFAHWLSAEENRVKIEKFYYDLYQMFKKVAPYNNISSKLWDIKNSDS
jgi:predicted ATP-dependent endonuclease of OLD family